MFKVNSYSIFKNILELHINQIFLLLTCHGMYLRFLFYYDVEIKACKLSTRILLYTSGIENQSVFHDEYLEHIPF